MSSKIAQYLGEHLDGEIVASPTMRRYFSTDGSIFEMLPLLVAYPKNDSDVQKIVRLAWQLGKKGQKLPLTPRGLGSDQGGAAIGRGISLVFPAHMNNLLTLDANKGFVRVQPGINYRNLQDVIMSHGLFLPPYPSSINFSTIGGAISNNAAGEKTIKYGSTRQYVKSLNVVLANGDLIQTGRLNKRELNRKKSQTDFEGEIYLSLDNLFSDNAEVLEKLARRNMATKNSSGYALGEVKSKDGSFDLTPLFVGSQGTLGVITEAELELEGYNPCSSLIVAHFDKLKSLSEAVMNLRGIEPSSLEIVDKHLLNFVATNYPAQLKRLISAPFPDFVLLIEFDDPSDRARKKRLKKALKILAKSANFWEESEDSEDQERLWALRRGAAATMAWYEERGAKALPIIEDGTVPPEQFASYISEVYKLFAKSKLQVALWGHAGDANLHMQPFLNLAKTGDRQKVFRLMDEYYAMIAKMGGSMSAEHGDGRLRGPYLEQFYGKEIYDLFRQVKRIFDPLNILNPGVKVNATKAEAMASLRKEYSMPHLGEHLPQL